MINFMAGTLFAAVFSLNIGVFGYIPSGEARPASEVVFIDPSVRDAEIIVSQLPKGAEVVRFSPGMDGVEQISAHLAKKRDLSAIRIISHGNAGHFVLNGKRIDVDFLRNHGGRISAWGRALAHNGDILLYPCNLAADEQGKRLIHAIAEWTGAHVAASTNLTGQGGDWGLEYARGTIKTAALNIQRYTYGLANQTVTRNDDTNHGGGGVEGDLRYAIANVGEGEEITFNISGSDTVTIAAELSISGKGLTINGNNSATGNNVTVQVTTPETSLFRVFNMNATGKTVNISKMTIKGGQLGIGGYGGSIFNGRGTLILDEVTVSGSKAEYGGGVYTENATTTLNNSTVSSCVATEDGGGVYGWNTTHYINNCLIAGNTSNNTGGGIANIGGSGPATIEIINSTIQGNTAEYYGGGIHNYSGCCNTSLTIINSTVSGNNSIRQDYGGSGIFNGEHADVTLTVKNSILANNASDDDYRFQGASTLTDNGYNIVKYQNFNAVSWTSTNAFDNPTTILFNYDDEGNAKAAWNRDGTDLEGTPALDLSNALADNGGFTRTLAITSQTSIAVGNGLYDASVTTTDQRGATRHNPGQTIGAYEFYADYVTNGNGTSWNTAANWNLYNGVTTPVATVAPTADNSISIAVNHNMNVDADVTIDQTAVASGKTLTVAATKTLTVANGDGTDLTVTGGLINNSTITCAADSIVLFNGVNQDLPSMVAFQDLTVSGGGIKTLTGGGVTVDGILTLTDGLVTLGNNDLTLGANATVTGTPSASNMIVTNGNGVLKKVFSATGSFTFPVGNNGGTPQYSPATLDFTSGAFNSAWAAVGVTDGKQPNNTSPTDYLNRYWTVTQSGISGFSCEMIFNYLSNDVVGTEADIFGGQYKDSAWIVLNAVDAANNRFQATISSFSDFTGVEASSPTTQANNISFSSVAQTQMQVGWTRGNGDKVLVVAHQGSAVDSNPVDGTGYTANAAFGSGSQIGTGNYVVYKGTGTSVTVTGLTAATTYHFRAYELNDTIDERYNTDTATGNPNNQTTLPNTPGAPTATAATATTQTGFSANWNAATGATGYRLDVATNSGFTSYVSGYQDRAYATDAVGTSYGNQVSFTTHTQAPTVTTQAVDNIGTDTAIGNGNVTDLGSPDPTQHGVCWNTTGTPTIGDSKTAQGPVSATGAFTSNMTGLSPDTTYHVRAYATNTGGTAYGNQVSFTTRAQAAIVTTQAETAIGETTATGNGNITNLGAPPPTEHGVCWNTSGTPTLADNNTAQGPVSAAGAFTSSMTVLSRNTTYYVRAYATDTAGTIYGNQVSFATGGQGPTVTTQAVWAIAKTTATGNGNITDLGAANPTQHGVCWNTTGTPTTADSKTTDGAVAATGAFTSNITGLRPGTDYYVRAYATNMYGTSYGNQVFFISAGRVDSGKPSSYKVTVTKVQMYNQTSWVTLFSGTAQLDTVAGGTFPGIRDLSLPAGAYSRIRIIFNNAFPVTGTLSHDGTAYYTTAATFEGKINLDSTPTTVAGDMVEFTFYEPTWGALNANVTQISAITPVTVGPGTDYQPTLRFTVSKTLHLKESAGNAPSLYFSLGVPTVSLVEP